MGIEHFSILQPLPIGRHLGAQNGHFTFLTIFTSTNKHLKTPTVPLPREKRPKFGKIPQSHPEYFTLV